MQARDSAEARPGDDAGAFGGPGEAMHAVSRLLGTAVEAGGPRALTDRLVREARHYFRVDTAMLLTLAEVEGGATLTAVDPPSPGARQTLSSLTELGPLFELLRRREGPLRISGDEARALARSLDIPEASGAVLLLLPMRLRESVRHLLVLAAAEERDFSPNELEVAAAFAAAATAGLAQLQLTADSAVKTAQQAALARAAKTLNESLDLDRVLVRICWEAASILEGDNASVYSGNARHGLRVQSTFGYPPELIGTRMAAGEGLSGKCVVRDEPMLTNDYGGMPRPPQAEQFADVRSCLAVPLHWDGELRGALSVGYTRPYLVTREHLSLLTAFGELAAVACRNASAHAGLAVAARTDALTGCLNHAALHDAL
ncbi:MAG TPA: GAF domain-containing protein, partial [Thermoleophilaceae bacterium]|nr:GAF domain-containing protein [Thermoleophilaceae bacterium]